MIEVVLNNLFIDNFGEYKECFIVVKIFWMYYRGIFVDGEVLKG